MGNFARNRLMTKSLIAAAVALATVIPATADDLDVFDAIIVKQNKPNVLFVLDYSQSMRRDIYGKKVSNDSPNSRLNILRSAVSKLLESNRGKVNVGIGSIFGGSASGVKWPISDLEEDAHNFDPNIAAGQFTVEDMINSELYKYGTTSNTVTVNALAEAAAYFRGDPVLNNDVKLTDPNFPLPAVWTGTEYNGLKDAAHPSSYTPTDAFANGTIPSYDSPLTNACQSNFMVLISDGSPWNVSPNTTTQTVLEAAGVPGGDMSLCEDLSRSIFGGKGRYPASGNCGPELLNYLATTDINPDVEGSNVKTFTVGFAVEGSGKEYLKRLADEGDEDGKGDFFEANNPEELTNALNSVLDSVLAGNKNFAELSVDIDPDGFSHDNRAYYSLFTPSARSAWNGNLKGYFIDNTGLVDVNGIGATVVDVGGLRFSDTAQSFWSANPDGNDVMTGGASESITSDAERPVNRNIHTYFGGTGTALVPGNNNTRLEWGNNNIDAATLNSASAAEAQAALTWLSTSPMGDPLHTKPVSVNYGNQQVVYIMTNQGFIHAFDTTKPLGPGALPLDVTGGEELFAFMPQELLGNVSKLYQRTPGVGHVYGLDGAITRWHDDLNDDGVVNNNEDVTLIFGMRRGGTSYYALDVSNPNAPEFKWQIKPGDIGFSRLAQTWSRPSLITVNNGGTSERMLMFAGGYDANAVDGTLSATAASGNTIFLVDMEGNLEWSLDETDHPDMVYSIPSDITVIDTDQNGDADRAYFGDLGGQVWRVDFADGTPELTKFADVSNGDHQPLFYAPSVSMNRDHNGRFLAVSFGSGDRTQPLLDNTDNALYMLKDVDIETGAPGASFRTINANAIYDATANDVGSDNRATAEAARAALESSRGWSVFLNKGEKSLSNVISFEGKYMATTFQPDPDYNSGGVPDPCSFNTVGRLYVMSILDAQPIEFSADGAESIASPDAAKRTTFLKEKLTIPGPPVVHFPADNSQVNVVVGKEAVATVNRKIRTVFWHAK